MNDLRQECESMKAEMAHLRSSVKTMALEKEYAKYVVVLQDINAMFQLETAIPTIQKLQCRRGSYFHYILNCDSSDLQTFKVRIPKQKLLTEISDYCKAIFEKRFGPNFIFEVSSMQVSAAGAVSQEDQTEALEWWTGSKPLPF